MPIDTTKVRTELDALEASVAHQDAANSQRVAALNAEVARLQAIVDGQTPDPGPVGATSVEFVDPPMAWAEGSAPTISVKTDKPMIAGQAIAVLAFKVGPAPTYTWTDKAELLMLLPGASMVIPAAALNKLSAGTTALRLKPTFGKVADHFPTITAATTTPPTGARGADTNKITTTITNFVPVSGTTYENLRIRGGVKAVWKSINNVTFVNCVFEGAAVLVTLQAKEDGSLASKNWTFKRCTFQNATRSDWGHSHGLYIEGTDNITIEDCLFKHNGWIGTKRFNQNHSVYATKGGKVTIRRTDFIESAAQGIKCKGFTVLLVEDCRFSGNLIDIGGDDRQPINEMVVRRCLFENTGGTDSNGATLGWCINLEYSSNTLNSVLIEDCKFAGPNVTSNARALKFSGGNLKSASVVRADLSQWTSTKIVNEIGDRLKVAAWLNASHDLREALDALRSKMESDA